MTVEVLGMVCWFIDKESLSVSQLPQGGGG